jgi:hypothetical protein
VETTPSRQPPVLAQRQIEQTVLRLLSLARSEEHIDRRGEPRSPYFRPISVMLDGPQRRQYSAFSREISPSGIGLLHNMPLDPSEVTLAILGPRGEACRFRTHIMWCRPCGEGWYLSGGRFLEAIGENPSVASDRFGN